MAKRMKSKIQPSALKMNFTFQANTTGKQFNYIDLSQCASLLNRRFYRQGLNWAVAGFKVTSNATQGQISIHKLPTTWVMSNAWEKSFRTWQKMNRESLAETQSVKPKFLDFKIFANAEHHDAGMTGNLLPLSAANSTGGPYEATRGEWIYSKVVIPETTTGTGAVTEYDLIAVGPNNPGVSTATGNNAKSLIEGYAASRGLPDILDPNTPDDANVYSQNWMMAMFNDGTLQDNVVLEDMITENNQAPYPFEGDGVATDTQYPGGANQLKSLEIHDQEFITSTTIGGKTYLNGGNFPCGLIEIATFGFRYDASRPEDADRLNIEVTMVPGDHRGYLAESMTEM